MLKITMQSEYWDEKNNCFVYPPAQTLELEHSLISIAKWEAKWHKSFISNKNKTSEEIIDYIRCMTITKNVDPDCYYRLSNQNIEEIQAYIDNPMSATYFAPEPEEPGAKKETITAELIYYWMIAYQIPIEFEKWHLSRLLTLIRLCEIKNRPAGKKGRKHDRSILSRNAALNAARRKRTGSKG